MERRFVMAALLALTLVTSGCVQAVTGETITFEASPATVADGALSDSGYDLKEGDEVTVDRTVAVPVVGERDVRITNHVRVYGPAAAGEAVEDENVTPAVLFLVSTPQAKVAGQAVNPLGRVPLRELVTRVVSRGQGLDDLERVGSSEVDTLGTTTTVEQYSTTAELDGESVPTYVYVTRVAHGDDFVVAVSMLPQAFSDEESTLYELLANVEHDDGARE